MLVYPAFSVAPRSKASRKTRIDESFFRFGRTLNGRDRWDKRRGMLQELPVILASWPVKDVSKAGRNIDVQRWWETRNVKAEQLEGDEISVDELTITFICQVSHEEWREPNLSIGAACEGGQCTDLVTTSFPMSVYKNVYKNYSQWSIMRDQCLLKTANVRSGTSWRTIRKVRCRCKATYRSNARFVMLQ